MSLCDIFPDDPSCQVAEPEPVPEPEPVDPEPDVVEGGEGEGDDEGEAAGEGEGEGEGEEVTATEKRVFDAILEIAKWEHIKQLSNFAMLDPFMSNLGYAMAAGGMAGSFAMDAFRYRSKSDYYDGAKIGTDTNWWKSSDMIRLWGGIALGGTLFVTQLLATFGIAVNLNAMIWGLAGLIGLGINVTIGLFRFLGLEAANTERKAKGVQQSMAGSIKLDMILDMIMDAGFAFAILDNMEGWLYGLWNAQSMEDQMKERKQWEESVAMAAEEYAKDKPASDKKEDDAEEGEEEGEGEEGEEGEGDAEEGGEDAAEGDDK